MKQHRSDFFFMDSNSTGLLIVLIVCILFSAFFSASETAFSTANRIRLKSLEQEGKKKAGKVLKILDDYDSLLSTLLIGNNIVNISASSISTVLFIRALGDIGATWSTVVLTVVILIFGEITPKSIAKEVPESFSMAVSGPIWVFMKIFMPLNKVFGLWKKLVKKVLHLNSEDKITEDEFMTMVEEAENDGGISEDDSELIKNVMDFNDMEVQEVLTPRVDVIAIPITASVREIEDVFRESDFTRLPVYQENLDDIVGYIHQKDFAEDVVRGKSTIQDILQPVLYVAPSMKIAKVLELLKAEHDHIAVVTDEFGGTDGIITMEDILEELVGEIYDEHDEEEQEPIAVKDDIYEIGCSMPLDDFFELFHMEEPESESNTVAGWVIEQFGEIPTPGQQFTYKNLEITAKTVDARKIDMITVKVLPEDEEHPDTEE